MMGHRPSIDEETLARHEGDDALSDDTTELPPPPGQIQRRNTGGCPYKQDELPGGGGAENIGAGSLSGQLSRSQAISLAAFAATVALISRSRGARRQWLLLILLVALMVPQWRDRLLRVIDRAATAL